MSAKSNKITGILIIVVFLAFVIWREYADKRLQTKGLLLHATTLNWAHTSTVGLKLKYEFYFNGEKIQGAAPEGSKLEGLKKFESRNFPVMFNPKYGISFLLVTPADFARFKLGFPDSLNWVLPYIGVNSNYVN